MKQLVQTDLLPNAEYCRTVGNTILMVALTIKQFWDVYASEPATMTTTIHSVDGWGRSVGRSFCSQNIFPVGTASPRDPQSVLVVTR
jgi:hypothetical protein